LKIVDIHTHAFPDKIAQRAIAKLSETTGDYRPHLDGRISSLAASMDEAGIAVSCLSSIATKPEQAGSILEWSISIRSERIEPLPSVHPFSQNREAEIDGIVRAGFRGIKLHPFYQDFYPDDKAVFPLYEQLLASGLFVLFHSGNDISFPGMSNAAPARIAAVHTQFPGLRIIAAHLGGWRDWDEVLAVLAGQDIGLDTSFSHETDPSIAEKILTAHSPDLVYFGSDSPWTSQKESALFIQSLDLSSEHKEKILGFNAVKLLGLAAK
jgi:predicted TIM-barrel fold metal-dependent hydrolase